MKKTPSDITTGKTSAWPDPALISRSRAHWQDQEPAGFSGVLAGLGLGSLAWADMFEFYLPFVQWLATLSSSQTDKPVLVGLSGPQGSGKSTLSQLAAYLLEQVFEKRTLVLSIDDFYYGKSQRQLLAHRIHPLLHTRGVPGTHDVQAAIDLLNRIKTGAENIKLQVPRFDKATDDTKDSSDWDSVTLPLDIVLLEGWCVGVPPQPRAALVQPTNQLERHEDAQGRWRDYVNDQLAKDYHSLFDMLDRLVVLNIPDFDCVIRWRLQQEQLLLKNWQARHPGRSVPASIMLNETQIRHFVMHFERLTRWGQQVLPSLADLLIDIDHQHEVVGVSLRSQVEAGDA